jgi:DNA primase
MAYRREDIEQVRAATDLVELISEVTKVKRSGRNVMAICPFHQEKTPSMSVDGARGLYHCFGCGKSGDLFRWVQETQALEFSDALELLARRAGITLRVDPQAAKRRGERESLIDAVRKAIDFYQQRLRSGKDAGSARAYLRGRGYDAETVDRFQLGYSPAGWDALVGHLRNEKVPEQAVVKAGLGSRSSTGRLVDRFRGRVMFPIFDLRGDPVGFGARILDGDGPKYLNSPETPLYHKSRLLYGLNWAKSEIVRGGRAVVVEGYTDVIGLHEAEMPIAVATCGTALGEDHFDLLRRFTEQVVLAFDADEAGAGASLRGFEHSVPGDLDLRVALLPEGQDPADLVSAGETDQLAKAIDESEPLLRFRLEKELGRFNLSEPEARARAIRAGAEVVARHRDPLARHEYAVLLARRTGVELDVVVAAVERAARHAGPEPARPDAPPARLRGYERTEQEVLRLLLANHPGLRDRGIDASWFTRPEHHRAFEAVAPAIAGLPAGEAPDLGSLSGDDDELQSLLSRLATTGEKLPDPDDVVLRLEVAALDRRIDEVEAELKALAPGADGYSAKFEELIALQQDRKRKGGPS